MIRHTYTLNEIEIRRAQTEKALQQMEQRIKAKTDRLLTPPPAENKMKMWIGNAERAYAVYDGVMTGYKLLKKIKHLFKRRKK